MKFSRWFLVSILSSILPFLFPVWKIYLDDLSGGISIMNAFVQTISRGELIILCFPIVFASIGELLYEDTRVKWFKNFLIMLSIVFVAVFMWAYFDIFTNFMNKKPRTSDYVFSTSVSIFSTALFISSLSLFIVKKQPKGGY